MSKIEIQIMKEDDISLFGMRCKEAMENGTCAYDNTSKCTSKCNAMKLLKTMKESV